MCLYKATMARSESDEHGWVRVLYRFEKKHAALSFNESTSEMCFYASSIVYLATLIFEWALCPDRP
jgi:hypothetical protein